MLVASAWRSGARLLVPGRFQPRQAPPADPVPALPLIVNLATGRGRGARTALRAAPGATGAAHGGAGPVDRVLSLAVQTDNPFGGPAMNRPSCRRRRPMSRRSHRCHQRRWRLIIHVRPAAVKASKCSHLHAHTSRNQNDEGSRTRKGLHPPKNESSSLNAQSPPPMTLLKVAASEDGMTTPAPWSSIPFDGIGIP